MPPLAERLKRRTNTVGSLRDRLRAPAVESVPNPAIEEERNKVLNMMELRKILPIEVRKIMEEWKGEIFSVLRGEVKAQAPLKGERGYTPQRGVDYFTPAEIAQIKRELKPRDGIDGKNPKPEDVVPLVLKKLPKVKKEPEKKVTIDDIEGLKEMLDAIRKQRRGGGSGGGGMGNVTHEHKAVSSATTTVSTASKIAGSGYALWVFYNGQMIARGTDYTVGTDFKTLTLTFSSQDNTVLDIIYFRS